MCKSTLVVFEETYIGLPKMHPFQIIMFVAITSFTSIDGGNKLGYMLGTKTVKIDISLVSS
jgi:hypothetical protein